MNVNWSRQCYEPTWTYQPYEPLSVYHVATQPEECDPMTTCIAGLANGGKSLILVADKLSIDVKKLVPQSENRTKILRLDDTHYVLMAGDETFAYGVYRRVIDSTKTYRDTREYADVIAAEYQELRSRESEAQILGPLRYNLETFKNALDELPPSTAQAIIANLENFEHKADNTEIMVVGIDNAADGIQANIFSVKAPGKVIGPATDFHAVSTVQEVVIDFLKSQDYSKGLDEDLATYLMFEAKKLSEISVAIGKKTDVIILDESGSFTVDSETLKALGSAYRELHKPMDKERKKLFARVGKIRKS